MRTLKVLVCLAVIGTLAGCAGVTRNVQSPGSSPETVSVAPAADLLALPHRYTVKTPAGNDNANEDRPQIRRRRSLVVRPSVSVPHVRVQSMTRSARFRR